MRAYISTYLRGVMAGRPWEDFPPLPPDHPDEFGTSGKVISLNIFVEAVRMLQDRHLRPVAVEQRVYDPKLQLAGTVDAIFFNEKKGDYVLVEWERRPGFKKRNPKHRGLRGGTAENIEDCDLSRVKLQLNLYCEILRRSGLCPIEKMFFLNICPIDLHPHFAVDIFRLARDADLMLKLSDHRTRQLAAPLANTPELILAGVSRSSSDGPKGGATP